MDASIKGTIHNSLQASRFQACHGVCTELQKHFSSLVPQVTKHRVTATHQLTFSVPSTAKDPRPQSHLAFPGFHHWSPNIKKPSCSPKAGTIGHSTLRVNLRLDPPSRSTGVLTITWKYFLLVKVCLFESDTRQTEPHRSKTFISVLFHTITVTKFLYFSSCSLTIQTPDPLLPPLPYM